VGCEATGSAAIAVRACVLASASPVIVVVDHIETVKRTDAGIVGGIVRGIRGVL